MRARPRKPRDLPSGLYRPGADHCARRRRNHHSRRPRTGEGRGTSPGEVHDIALKAAETDATKRALPRLESRLGWRSMETERRPLAKGFNGSATPADLGQEVRFARDHTTPIPRPSRYYGRRQDLVTRDRAQGKQLRIQPSEASIVPPSSDLFPAQIDKSVLAIAEPKRIWDKAHLRFVASQPCLICGRQPSDPHHLRFAQPRALGLKVSDEFTVPLCRGHHRQLHQAGTRWPGGGNCRSMRLRWPSIFGNKAMPRTGTLIRKRSQ